MINILTLFPLQSITNFTLEDPSFSPTQIIIFVAVFAVIVVALVFLNSANKKSSPAKSKSSGGGGGGGGGFSGLSSMFALRKLTKNIGMDSTQKKMLDFVFKTDGVSEPEKSINNPLLLDRHFRRAFRIIEQSPSSNEEVQRKLTILFSTRNLLENSPVGAITSTKMLKEDTVITLSNGKDKFEVAVTSAKDESLVVDAPTNVLGSQIKIPHGARLSAVFFTKGNKGFSFETRVIGYSQMHGRPVMQLAHSAQIKFLSVRRYRRKQAVIDCFLYLVYVEGSGKKQRLIVDKRRINGTIADISIGGCSIKAVAPVQVGARFKIEFIQRNASVAALGQVLRTNRAGMNTTIHFKFLRISQKSMNTINAFVYEYVNE
ncbi:MAG: PilZ domain-containing protein [Treponema sp.]|jgi:c-di-GMP-binding flagellar brake protein YcgR|nr:PilZ domain-containing protein [Treponema sp.]